MLRKTFYLLLDLSEQNIFSVSAALTGIYKLLTQITVHIMTDSRYERLEDILNLAIALQGSYRGLTLDDIQARFKVSRRTAERMRDAIGRVFTLKEADRIDDDRKRWIIRSKLLPSLSDIRGNLGATLFAMCCHHQLRLVIICHFWNRVAPRSSQDPPHHHF